MRRILQVPSHYLKRFTAINKTTIFYGRNLIPPENKAKITCQKERNQSSKCVTGPFTF